MPQLIDMTGQVCGRLTVLSHASTKGGKGATWHCQCVCGAVIIAHGANLRRGNTKSCGCLNREQVKLRSTTHGFSIHPLYNTWRTMVARCENPCDRQYSSYGGRGIKCLLLSPQALEDAIGPKPSTQHTVDRIDNEGHYIAGNIWWAPSMKEQSRNRRNNLWLTWRGKTQCLADWAKELNITSSCLSKRLKKGWSLERALSQPVATAS
jgi:hypothetical protein